MWNPMSTPLTLDRPKATAAVRWNYAPIWRWTAWLLALLPLLTASERVRAQEGITFEALYVADVMHNARGGIKTGTGYLDDLRLQMSVDAEKSLGIEGGTFFAFARAINSGDFATRYSGEFQKVSNIDASPAVRLYEAWYEQTFFENRVSVRAGLYDLNTEFDANPVAVLFLNAAQGIGTEFGQTGRNGPSIFPVTSLAARIDWHDPSGLGVRFAILDGVPGDIRNPKRTAIKLGDGDGALLVAQADYAWSGGQFAVGGWQYTARFDDIVDDASGLTHKRKDNAGAYGFITNRFFGNDEGGPALDAYVRVGIAQPSINPVAAYFGAGVVGAGIIPGRPLDLIGFSIGIARTGSPYRKAAIIGGGLATKHETELEVTYRAELAPWLTVQPDLQFVIHPGFDPTLKNALVVGIRFEIAPMAVFN